MSALLFINKLLSIEDAEIPLADEFALFKKLCDVLYERKRFDQLQRVTFSAMGSPYFNKKPELMKVRLRP